MSGTPKRSLDGENVSDLAGLRRSPSRAAAPSHSSQKLYLACLAGLCGAGALSLTGCSSLTADVREFQEGWRTADVVAIGSAQSIRRGGRTDCRISADSAEISTGRFARISYRAAGSRHAHVILVTEPTALAVGDVIYTNVGRCGSPIFIRPKVVSSAIGAGPAAGSLFNPNL